MGCDGGTIPRRDELVKTKQKPEQKDRDAETVAKWKHCSISQRSLKPPIVSCALGRLYNKDSVIEYLLNKESAVHPAHHIKSLKDVKELKFTENAGYEKKAADLCDEYVDRQASLYICPVVGLEMNGRHKFFYMRQCGCVISERAFKEVKSETCHKCGKSYEEDDLIVINGTETESNELYSKMEQRRAQAKQDKKRKNKLSDIPASTSKDVGVVEKKVKFNDEPKASTSGASKKTTSTVSKLALPQKLQSFTVSKDPKASEAYKSLFTTHQTALNQPKQHWITHNPLFY